MGHHGTLIAMQPNIVFAIVGGVFLTLAPMIFARPRWFMWGYTAKRWVTQFGETVTLRVIRFVTAPMMFFGGTVLLLLGLGVL